MKVHRKNLCLDDQFVRDMPQYRAKPRPVTYTVTGYMVNKHGREYLEVRSLLQGDGCIAVEALPEWVEVVNR